MLALILILLVAPDNYDRITVTKVLDGDTIKAEIHVGYDIILKDKTIRLYGFDAWEMSRRRQTVGEITDEEIRRGGEAKEALQRLLARGPCYIQSFGVDVYGRVLGRIVVIDGSEIIDIGLWMEDHGHSRDREPIETRDGGT